MENKIFLFHGRTARFTGAAFSTLELAEAWIRENKLSGMLTAYPIDISVFDWAVKNKFFTPQKDDHNTASFIGGFTSASLTHYHYEKGSSV